mmetsp:Transcript_44891/g.87903  ORF Transcript_44891/g.87903 Transcript_44891/m.87903 type:complete len:154 (-) Transcript_44891:6-467(-)
MVHQQGSEGEDGGVRHGVVWVDQHPFQGGKDQIAPPAPVEVARLQLWHDLLYVNTFFSSASRRTPSDDRPCRTSTRPRSTSRFSHRPPPPASHRLTIRIWVCAVSGCSHAGMRSLPPGCPLTGTRCPPPGCPPTSTRYNLKYSMYKNNFSHII